MKKLLILLALLSPVSCTTVVDTPEPAVTRETETTTTTLGYPPVQRSTTTIVQ